VSWLCVNVNDIRTFNSRGLAGFGARITYRLSAGEQRLVALATVLAMHPRVLLLDEPTTGLDRASQARLLEHLAGLRQAMVIVSHDLSVLERLATRAVKLAQGRLTCFDFHTQKSSVFGILRYTMYP
jgi:cobalt/nickel transport system ATP-binding protein